MTVEDLDLSYLISSRHFHLSALFRRQVHAAIYEWKTAGIRFLLMERELPTRWFEWI